MNVLIFFIFHCIFVTIDHNNENLEVSRHGNRYASGSAHTRNCHYTARIRTYRRPSRRNVFIAATVVFLFSLSAGDAYGAEESGFIRLWRYAAGGKISKIEVDTERKVIYAVAEDRYLHAISFAGERLWRSYIDSGTILSLKTGCDGTIYILTDGGKLLALNRAGGIIWRIRPFHGPVVRIHPLRDGTIICIGGQGEIAAYSHSAVLRWRGKIFGPGSIGGVVSSADYQIPTGAGTNKDTSASSAGIAVGFAGGDLVVIDENGMERWYESGEHAVGELHPLGDRLGMQKGSVLLLYSSDGKIAQRVATGEVVSSLANPLSGHFLVRSTDGFLSLYDASGERLWKRPAGGGICFLGGNEETSLLLDYQGWCEVYTGAEGLSISGRLPPPSTAPHLIGSSRFVYGGDDWIIRAFRTIEPAETEEKADGKTANEASATGAGGSTRGSRKESEAGKCASLRSGGMASFPLLRQELLFGNRERHLRVLREVRRRLESPEPAARKKAFLSVLEEIAGEGVLRTDYRRGKIENDFPELRAEAVRLLGIYGDIQSLSFINSLGENEWDGEVLLRCIEALGLLGGMENGADLFRMGRSISSSDYAGNDPGSFALVVIEATKRISRYQGRIQGEVMEILKKIYLGPFPRSVRNTAISTLRDLRGSAYLHFSDYTENDDLREEEQ